MGDRPVGEGTDDQPVRSPPAPRPAPADRAEADPPPRRAALAAAVAVPVVVGAVVGSARWSGRRPFGSDNDEYRLLADAVWQGSVRIAEVEGTKYPVGWSALLGLADRLGLPPTGTALVANVVLLVVLAALVWHLVPGRPGPSRLVGSSVAATVVVASVSVWSSVVVVMPDLALVVVVAAALVLVGRLRSGRQVAALVALVAAACLLKSVGVLLAAAAVVPLVLDPRWRRWSWSPLAAGLGITGAQAAWTAGEPQHTTGYAATFWLADPFDAAGPSLGLLDLPGRVVARADLFLADVAGGAFGPTRDGWLAIALAVVLVGASLLATWRDERARSSEPADRGGSRAAWAVQVAAQHPRTATSVPFLVLYGVFLSAWPYSSDRFGMVVLPWVASGAGAVVVAVADRWRVAVAVAASCLVLVPHVLEARADAVHRADAEAVQIDALEAGIAEADGWLAVEAAPGDGLASLDYRELAYRTDRTYLPVPYTSDPDALWEATAGSGARWLVALSGLYPQRERVVGLLVAARPDEVVPVASFGAVTIYELRP